MKKIIPFFAIIIALSSCDAKLDYNTFTKAQVDLMMGKYYDLEQTHSLPDLNKTFNFEPAKLTKALAKKGVRIKIIIGSLYLDSYPVDSLRGKQAIILQFKSSDGKFEYADYRTLRIDGEYLVKGNEIGKVKAICPEPKDCRITIED